MIPREDINDSLTALHGGGIILYPTDTIWGLGCDPTNGDALKKIFRIKLRDPSKSLIILVDSMAMVERYVSQVPEIAYELTDVTDSPITIIYPNGKNLAPGVCSDDGSVAIRICNDQFCNELITRFRKPLVSTSANFSGKPAPANFSEIDKELFSSVDFVVKYRQNDRESKIASPVIKINTNGTIEIIRK